MNKYIDKQILRMWKYCPKKIKKILIEMICNKEGGEAFSLLARDIWEKYYFINFGLGSYGILNNYFGGREDAKVNIGKFCSIASGVSRYNTNHPIHWACMNPVFYEEKFGYCNRKLDRNSLTIGNDVWIAHNVTLLKGCTKIGNGAIIGAGSVVTKDIPPYEIWYGVPAHFVKKRFSSDVIELLERSEWWNLSIEELMMIKGKINNPLDFAERAIMLKETNYIKSID